MKPVGKGLIDHLRCSVCERRFDSNKLQSYCQECHAPIFAQYDIAAIKASVQPDDVKNRPRGIWRWWEILPVLDINFRVSLGEGDTPLLKAARMGKELGVRNLYIKDESQNPTGTFKARGLAVAVSRGLELGVDTFVVPTAGNAGSALAVYSARAGCEAHVYMPADTPKAIQSEVQASGAGLHLVNGIISDAARQAGELAVENQWFDVSTFKEPYRVEGKKTMGLELAESFDWQLPDVIIYPTGGGTGLIGIWKAFAELEALGWIDAKRPRMVSVQSDGCAPIVRAFHSGASNAEPWKDANTVATGLCVPSAFADQLILNTLRESEGTAVQVADAEITASQQELAQKEGIFAAPEGAATLAGLRKLIAQEWIQPNESVVLFNTGSGLKYV
jgi:threonine synthase